MYRCVLNYCGLYYCVKYFCVLRYGSYHIIMYCSTVFYHCVLYFPSKSTVFQAVHASAIGGLLGAIPVLLCLIGVVVLVVYRMRKSGTRSMVRSPTMGYGRWADYMGLEADLFGRCVCGGGMGRGGGGWLRN